MKRFLGNLLVHTDFSKWIYVGFISNAFNLARFIVSVTNYCVYLPLCVALLKLCFIFFNFKICRFKATSIFSFIHIRIVSNYIISLEIFLPAQKKVENEWETRQCIGSKSIVIRINNGLLPSQLPVEFIDLTIIA